MAGIGRINAADVVLPKIKSAAKSVVENIKENKAAYALAAGAVAAAGAVDHLLSEDTVEVGHYKMVGYETDKDGVPLDGPIGYVPKMEWSEEPTAIQKARIKMREGITRSGGHGFSVTEPYLKDGNGHYIMGDYGAIENPCYDPEKVKELANMGAKTSMDEFLSGAGIPTESAHEKLLESGLGIADVHEEAMNFFGTGAEEALDGAATAAGETAHSLFEKFIDAASNL